MKLKHDKLLSKLSFNCNLRHYNAGHVALLRAAKQQGDFLLVGIHDDDAVRRRLGVHHPILNVQERSLGVLACRHVDEVIMGAPGVLTRDLVTTFNVSVVLAVRRCRLTPGFCI